MSRCKMFLHLIIVTWLLFYNKCFCISEEYYNDEFLEKNKNITIYNHTNSRETDKEFSSNLELNNNFFDPHNSRKQYSFNSKKKNDISNKVEPHGVTVGALEHDCKIIGNSTYLNLDKIQCTQKIPQVIDLKSFRDYEYEAFDTRNDKVSPISGLETNQGIKNQSQNDRQNQSEIMKSPNVRFYNLESAISHVVKVETNKTLLRSNIWYVPQEFPCWDLPVIYGKLGEKKNKSEIFKIYGGNLVNVIDNWTVAQNTFKVGDPPISHSVNKWCGLQPCYADHTLCLFPNAEVSNICDRGYRVRTPTVMDQITIISTINAMRNRVAHGLADIYSHLPTAANMQQINYDYDLEKIAEAWLRQCLPGAAPCSALDGLMVSQLECMKYMKFCCLKKFKTSSHCTPSPECFIHPIIGCIHVWFSSAGNELSKTDVLCGRSTVRTFNTVQLLWAKTSKIGCAYGERSNGNIRVVCKFSPAALFHLDTKLFCGMIDHDDIAYFRNNENVTNLKFLTSFGIKWNHVRIGNFEKNISIEKGTILHNKVVSTTETFHSQWGVDSLTKVYNEGWIRKLFDHNSNGTRGLVGRLVARHIFTDDSESKCDLMESIYEVGSPGSSCIEKSSVFDGLCYEFREPTTGFRVIAIAAPIALFSLILYDLFSGVIRQTNY